MHIGNKIKEVIIDKGMSVPDFAAAVPCTREHAYKIFHKENIDTGLLMKICRILDHDFFSDLSGCI